jgi:hypothetical protein
MLVTLDKSGWALVPPRLARAGWPDLLKTWARLIHRWDLPYEGKRQREDVAYWYGERALTGILAAAAWHTHRHWWGLEEFLGKKFVESILGKAEGKSGPGRGDLWLGLHVNERRGEQHCYTIEAKQSLFGTNAKEIARAIEKNLSKARAQLAQLNEDFRLGCPMAVCFHIPAPLTKSKRVSEWTAPDEFREAAQSVMKHPHTIAAAVLRSKTEAPEDGKWTFPGVLLVARQYQALPGSKGRPRWKGELCDWV